MLRRRRGQTIQVLPDPPSHALGKDSLVGVDNRNEIRDFLASRRARITPEQAGLPAYGTHRRVPRLRREEVALLAGVSIDYLDAIASAPAYLRNGRRDILAANQLGHALYSEMYVDPVRPVNVARFIFLSPRARTFFLDWEKAATDAVAILRSEAGRNPYDRAPMDLVGELSTGSKEFRTRWASHNVRFHRTGFKDLHHPIVGDLHLTFEAMDLPADPGLSLVVYSAEPGSASEDGLKLLASWAATPERPEQAEIADAEETRP
jgi:MmyB-like transcription regulator ligand binding domain